MEDKMDQFSSLTLEHEVLVFLTRAGKSFNTLGE